MPSAERSWLKVGDDGRRLGCLAVPIARRMPAWVRRTSDELVGEGRSAALWAWEMTTRRRAMVAAFNPAWLDSILVICPIEQAAYGSRRWPLHAAPL